MVGSPPNPKTISHSRVEDQGVLNVRNPKKVIKTRPINYQKLNLKKKHLLQRLARKLIRKDGIRFQKRTQNHEARQGKNRKRTQLKIQRFWKEKLYRKHQKPSPLIRGLIKFYHSSKRVDFHNLCVDHLKTFDFFVINFSFSSKRYCFWTINRNL